MSVVEFRSIDIVVTHGCICCGIVFPQLQRRVCGSKMVWVPYVAHLIMESSIYQRPFNHIFAECGDIAVTSA